jgi:hypothetical protein
MTAPPAAARSGQIYTSRGYLTARAIGRARAAVAHEVTRTPALVIIPYLFWNMLGWDMLAARWALATILVLLVRAWRRPASAALTAGDAYRRRLARKAIATTLRRARR